MHVIWHTETLDNVLNELKTDAKTGLTAEEAGHRLAGRGHNLWSRRMGTGFGQRLAAQVAKPMILLLLAVAVIATFVILYQNDWRRSDRLIEPLAMVVVAVVTVAIGALQEGYAERTLDGLRSMQACSAKVLRDGKWQTVSSTELVPGDIIEVAEGALCPADCRLIEAVGLTCDEYLLTEDTSPTEKWASATPDHIAPIFKRANMLYAGCAVTAGRGTAVVVETAAETEIGKRLSMLVPEKQAAIPLQGKLAGIGKTVSVAVSVVCIVFLIIGLLMDIELLSLMMTAMAMAVAIIPEGLTAAATMVLAIGVKRMADRHVRVRQLSAVETAGQVTVICTDKTGVLTQNKPILKSLCVGGRIYQLADTNRPDADVLVRLAALCSDAGAGDPIEDAILQAAISRGMQPDLLLTNYPRVGELPFDRERKRMTTVHLFGEQMVAIVKGAPEKVLDLCADVDMDEVAKAYVQMGQNGQHVLAIAYKAINEETDRTVEEIESDLNFAGLIGLEDPICPKAAAALRAVTASGVHTVMMTGDHITTATAVAKTLGLIEDEAQAIDGATLAAMSDEELAAHIREFRVYARITAGDKRRIVQAWQQAGEVVAITGKEVGDVAALRAADIGLVTDLGADDAARGNADMVLTDNRFVTLVDAISGSRGIYTAIQRITRFFLSSNLGELLLMVIGLLAFGRPALLPMMLLWINVVTDTLPAVAFGAEPAESQAAHLPPRAKNEPFLLGATGLWTVIEGLMIAVPAIIAYIVGKAAWSLEPTATAMTMAFAVLVLSQLVHMLCLRTARSIFGWHSLKNKQMLVAFGAGLALVLTVLLVPVMQSWFGFAALTGGQWLLCSLLSLIPLAVSEIAKLASKKKVK